MLANIDHLKLYLMLLDMLEVFFVSALPRMCTFPELFRDMYMFGDINTYIYKPNLESKSQMT